MKFLGNTKPPYELTYSDVFVVPSDIVDIRSRSDVDTTTVDGLGTTTPVIVSNMNASAGKRMAETTARRGAMTMLLQNLPFEKNKKTVEFIKSRHPIFDTPIVMKQDDKINAALSLINKRAHGAIIITDEKERPIGIFRLSDAEKQDRYTRLKEVMSKDLVVFDHKMPLKKMFDELVHNHVEVAPVIKDGVLLGVTTKSGIVRSELHQPALDSKGKLMVGVAIGINEDIASRVRELETLGVDAILLDTANGHQKRLLEAIKVARSTTKKMKIMAGTVVTAGGTKNIIEAGADIVKVGIGAGATCITRMQTGVGRPQFSAVLECSQAAKKAGGFVMADGGIRHPRDVALALVGGASTTMFASWLTPTFESPADIHVDSEGRLYVEHFGMASNRAVLHRNKEADQYSKMKKAFFEEGSSHVQLHLKEGQESVEDILDSIVSGLRSTCTYVGARNLEELHDKAIIGVQSPAAFNEGRAVAGNWS